MATCQVKNRIGGSAGLLSGSLPVFTNFTLSLSTYIDVVLYSISVTKGILLLESPAGTKTRMFGGIVKPEGSAQEFWGENKIGGRCGWGSYTVEVLLLILIFQLAAKIWFLLGGSFLSTIITRFRSAAAIVLSPASNNNHSLKLKNPTVSPSKEHPHKYNHR